MAVVPFCVILCKDGWVELFLPLPLTTRTLIAFDGQIRPSGYSLLSLVAKSCPAVSPFGPKAWD